MRAVQSECPGPDRQRLSAIFSDATARRLLSCLQSGPATPGDLATSLAAADRDCPPAAVRPEDQRRYRQRLYHDHLPRLEAADLVDRPAGELVRLIPVPSDRFDVSLPAFDEPDDPNWPAAAAVLARPYRYPLLSLLVDADDPVPLSVLAGNLAESDPESAEPSRDLSVALHHVDLPKLADVGVVSYDTETTTAVATPNARSLL